MEKALFAEEDVKGSFPSEFEGSWRTYGSVRQTSYCSTEDGHVVRQKVETVSLVDGSGHEQRRPLGSPRDPFSYLRYGFLCSTLRHVGASQSGPVIPNLRRYEWIPRVGPPIWSY